MADNIKKMKFTIEVNDKGKVKVEGLTRGFVKLDTAVKKVTTSVREQQAAMSGATKDGLNPMIDKTGLAGATLVELGRTISDSNYGIRGMANNLSQLSTLFITLISTTGGLVNGIKALTRAFLGPLGIILAFQAVIAMIEKQDMEAQKLKRTTDSLGNQVAKTAGNFEIYVRKLQDANESKEQQSLAIKKLKKEYPDFVKQLNESSLSFEDIKNKTNEASAAIDNYRREIIKLAFSKAAQTKIEKLAAESIDIEQNAIEELKKGGKTLDEARELWAKREEIRQDQSLTDVEKLMAINKLFRDSTVEGKEEFNKFNLDAAADIIDALDAENIKIQEQINLLVKRVKLEDDAEKGRGARESLKRFRQGVLSFQEEIQRLRQESLDQFIRDEETKIAKESTDLMMMLRVRTEDFKKRQEQRLKDFKDSNATNEAKAEAEIKYLKSIELAEKELAEAIIAVEERAEAKRTELRLKRAQEVTKTLYQIQAAEAELADSRLTMPQVFTENAITQRMKQLEFEIQLQKGLVDIYEQGTEERANAELRLAQLQKQLVDENLAYQKQRFGQIKEIYNQGASAVSFISEAIKNKEIRDAGESAEAIEAAKKKAWQVEKALKISQVIMQTYENGWLAYGSQLFPGDPTSPIRANIAQALTLISGAAQVAAIASTKFDSKSISGAGGGRGAGPQVEAPDFNVVGASPESQLARSVSQQQEKPLRAFVVHQDIKNAEQLDNRITQPTGL